jgi:hypothetical protein
MTIGEELPTGTRVIEVARRRGTIIEIKTFTDRNGAEGDFPIVKWEGTEEPELMDWYSLIREEEN